MKAMLDKLPFNGYKTYLASAALLMIGLGGLTLRFLGIEEHSLSIEEARQLFEIAIGIMGIGIGHKLDKINNK